MNVRSAIHLVSLRPVFLGLALAFAAAQPATAAADKIDPAADAKAFQKYFTDKFPKVKLEDFVNGPYSMNEDMHRQWVEKEEFPPYEFSLDMGKEMFAKPFKNGKSYADCFANGGIGVRQNYPYFDEKEGKVVTLELALNRCREANGEPPFSYVKDEMAALTAYMAFTSRGKPFDIKIPNDPRALEAFETGKQYFYTRRGQLNFSCASCHVQNPGQRIRAEILAPALGILNAMPIYRSEWGGMGTISRRFTTCNVQTRGVPLEPQSDEYRDLEYYLSYVSNGLPISGPGSAAMSMTQGKVLISMLALVATLLGVGAHSALAAATEDDFKAAYAAAVDANKQAAQLRDQWTVTATALVNAKKAADAGDFDKAVAASKEAEALAEASVFQATSEKDAWKAMEIH